VVFRLQNRCFRKDELPPSSRLKCVSTGVSLVIQGDQVTQAEWVKKGSWPKGTEFAYS
jgi:hypothetical protein